MVEREERAKSYRTSNVSGLLSKKNFLFFFQFLCLGGIEMAVGFGILYFQNCSKSCVDKIIFFFYLL